MTNGELLKFLKLATDELQLEEDLKKTNEENLLKGDKNDDEDEDLHGKKALLY